MLGGNDEKKRDHDNKRSKSRERKNKQTNQKGQPATSNVYDQVDRYSPHDRAMGGAGETGEIKSRLEGM